MGLLDCLCCLSAGRPSSRRPTEESRELREFLGTQRQPGPTPPPLYPPGTPLPLPALPYTRPPGEAPGARPRRPYPAARLPQGGESPPREPARTRRPTTLWLEPGHALWPAGVSPSRAPSTEGGFDWELWHRTVALWPSGVPLPPEAPASPPAAAHPPSAAADSPPDATGLGQATSWLPAGPHGYDRVRGGEGAGYHPPRHAAPSHAPRLPTPSPPTSPRTGPFHPITQRHPPPSPSRPFSPWTRRQGQGQPSQARQPQPPPNSQHQGTREPGTAEEAFADFEAGARDFEKAAGPRRKKGKKGVRFENG